VVVDREHRLHRIKRAGADITENDTQRAEGQPEQAAAVNSRMVGIAARHSRLGCSLRRVAGLAIGHPVSLYPLAAPQRTGRLREVALH
jgi:hypothetical protein